LAFLEARIRPLTTGVDTLTGGAGNDTFNGTVDSTPTPSQSTLTALDSITGGLGNDTLNVNVITGAIPAITLTGVETVNIRAAVAVTTDVSNFTGLTAVNVTQAAGALALTSASTTAVTVSGATAGVAITGGSSATLTKAMNATAGAVTIDKVGAVTVTATDSVAAAGDIVIGGTTAVTGAVSVTSTGAKIVGGTGAVSTDLITITGGTTVSVTEAATADMGDVATKGIATDVITQGAVTVTGGNATTSVSVVQAPVVAAVAAVAAITGVSATKTVTFVAMAANDWVSIDGLKFTATKALTAAEAAAAFAGLTATETQGQGFSSNGTYSVTTSTAKWTSGAVVGNSVTFSQTVAGAIGLTLAQSIAAVPQVTEVAGVSGILAQTAKTGVLGVANGAVVIDDNAVKSITTLTVSGYSAGATLGGATATKSLDALTTLNLANSSGGAAAVNSTATTLALNVNNINKNAAGTASTVTVDVGGATVKTLNLTTATADSAYAVI